MKRQMLARGLSTIALVLCSGMVAAAAQTESADQSGATKRASVDTGDIVVTAQRRSESLQNVPISVTAVSAESIERLNIRNIDKIATVTPGLIYDTGHSFVQIFIRGVGDQTPGVGLETPVATYIDGAYLERGAGTIFDLVDVATVEVLKGPQGTLYGRNATGGAILITTANPTNVFEAKGLAEYGRFDHTQLEAVVNVPVSDTLAVRFAGRHRYDGGFIKNVTNNEMVRSKTTDDARMKVKWTPTTEFSALLSLEYHHEKGNANASGRADAGIPFCPSCVVAPPTFTGFYQVAEDFRRVDEGRSYNANLQLEYGSGPLTLKSLTAYRDHAAGITDDVDHTANPSFVFDSRYGGKTFQQDLQIASDFGGAFDFLTGVSYLHDDAFQRSFVYGTTFGAPYVNSARPAVRSEGRQFQITKSYSVFGEVYIKPIEALTVTVGGRYTKDKRKLDTINNALAVQFNNPGGPLEFTQRATYDRFTPRFVVAYDAGDVNFYASYTQGFRAGGFNTPSYAPRTEPILPEIMTSYEIGAKYVSPDRRTRVNAAAFQYDYEDVIVSILEGTTRIVRNAAAARGKGVELDVSQRATDWLTLSAGGQYLDAKYRNYPNGATYVYRRNAAGDITGIGLGNVDLSGVSLPRAPKWTFTLAASIEAPITDEWTGRFNINTRYTSSYDFVVNRSGVLGADFQDDLILTNLSASVGPNSGAYEVGIYVDNLTGEKYYANRVTGGQGINSLLATPTQYGVRVKFQF